MTVSTGQDSHLVYAIESTPFTREAPTIAVPHISESLRDAGSQPIKSSGILKGRRGRELAGTTRSDITGTINLPLIADSIGGLLRAAFGDAATTGAGPFEHVFTRATLEDDAFSAQVGWDDDAGTAFRKDISGAMVNGWTLDVQPNAQPTLAFDVAARRLETDAYAEVVPSYTDPLQYFEFFDATVNIAGGGNVCINGINVQGANNLEASDLICPPPDNRSTIYQDVGEFAVTGTINKDFVDWTFHDLFVAGTEATIVITLTADASTAILLVELNVVFTGETPAVDGMSKIANNLPFEAVGDTDAEMCTVTLTNNDSTV